MLLLFFFFKQKTAYEMRISDWSSDVCSSDLITIIAEGAVTGAKTGTPLVETPQAISVVDDALFHDRGARNVQETLRYSAGVTGEAYGLDTRNDATVIRGLSPVQFLDGMRNFYTYAPFARNSIDTLDRVEVLRGPSSVLYGQERKSTRLNSSH